MFLFITTFPPPLTPTPPRPLRTQTGLMEKDLGLAVDIATKTKCRVPLGAQAHQLYGMLSDHG